MRTRRVSPVRPVGPRTRVTVTRSLTVTWSATSTQTKPNPGPTEIFLNKRKRNKKNPSKCCHICARRSHIDSSISLFTVTKRADQAKETGTPWGPGNTIAVTRGHGAVMGIPRRSTTGVKRHVLCDPQRVTVCMTNERALLGGSTNDPVYTLMYTPVQAPFFASKSVPEGLLSRIARFVIDCPSQSPLNTLSSVICPLPPICPLPARTPPHANHRGNHKNPNPEDNIRAGSSENHFKSVVSLVARVYAATTGAVVQHLSTPRPMPRWIGSQ